MKSFYTYILVAVILLFSTSAFAHPPSTYENSFPYEISSETDPQGQIIVPVPPGGINKWLQQLIATMGPVSDGESLTCGSSYDWKYRLFRAYATWLG